MSAPAPNGATTTAAPAANDARDPSGFLSEIIGAPVTVKLNSGVVYKGKPLQTWLGTKARGSRKLAQHTFTNIAFFFHTIGELQSVDGYMNIALEGTREFVDGKMRRSYGDAFVRGNNGMFCLFPMFSAFLIQPLSVFRSSRLGDSRFLVESFAASPHLFRVKMADWHVQQWRTFPPTHRMALARQMHADCELRMMN
jgi:U6 snRNA-associated Sm-like protein LSm6